MNRAKVTSYDVARLAGVSRTTVSLVLNRSSTISLSDATRKKVMDAATELGYQPNSAARMLVRGDTETIGLVISDPAILPIDGFIPQLLFGISQYNAKHGYHVLLETVQGNKDSNPYERLVEARRIDGLIVLNPNSDDPNLRDLIDRKFPVVIVGSVRHEEELSVNHTTGDAIGQAVDHLIALGHKHFGCVALSKRGLVATDVRLATLRRELARYGLSLDDKALEYGNFSAESGYKATLKLLETAPQTSAVFAGNDTIAIGVIQAAIAMGRQVPQDLSVIGYDDLPFAAWLNPPLTTIHVDAITQGKLAAELLIKKLRNEPIDNPRPRIESSFIIRASTGQIG